MSTSHTTLKSMRSRALAAGASATQIGGYVMNRAYAKIIGLSICNTSGVSITATGYVQDASALSYNLIYNTPIAVGATLIIAGPNDQFAVLQAGDRVYVSVAGAGGTADVLMSVEERSE